MQPTPLSSQRSYRYMLCGWRTLSDMPLTAVPQSDAAIERAEVRITVQSAAGARGRSDEPIFDHGVDRSLINISDVAAFEVRAGKHIVVSPHRGVAAKDVEIFLLGPA